MKMESLQNKPHLHKLSSKELKQIEHLSTSLENLEQKIKHLEIELAQCDFTNRSQENQHRILVLQQNIEKNKKDYDETFAQWAILAEKE